MRVRARFGLPLAHPFLMAVHCESTVGRPTRVRSSPLSPAPLRDPDRRSARCGHAAPHLSAPRARRRTRRLCGWMTTRSREKVCCGNLRIAARSGAGRAPGWAPGAGRRASGGRAGVGRRRARGARAGGGGLGGWRGGRPRWLAGTSGPRSSYQGGLRKVRGVIPVDISRRPKLAVGPTQHEGHQCPEYHLEGEA